MEDSRPWQQVCVEFGCVCLCACEASLHLFAWARVSECVSLPARSFFHFLSLSLSLPLSLTSITHPVPHFSKLLLLVSCQELKQTQIT